MKLKIILGIIAVGAGIGLGVVLFQPDTEMQVSADHMPGNVTVTTVVDYGETDATYERTLTSATTALDVLLLIAQDESLDVKTTEYDFGILVDSINGIGTDTTDNHYWIYYINGETATEGASTYQVQDGDTIRWNYEESIY